MTETTNYGLKKPAEGSSGWAEDVNGNFDEIDSKMKDNEGIGETLSNHLSPGSTKHTAEQIASQVGDALGTQDGLDGLLRAIIGTLEPSEFTTSLNTLRNHLASNSNFKHSASDIQTNGSVWGIDSLPSVYTALHIMFNKWHICIILDMLLIVLQ